jgi:hypothetical protein
MSKCDVCGDDATFRKVFNLDLQKTDSVIVCPGCFSDLCDVATRIRDASCRMALAIVRDDVFSPVDVGAGESLVYNIVDAEDTADGVS